MYKKLENIKKFLLTNKLVMLIIILIFILLSAVVSPYLNNIFMNEQNLKKIVDKDICFIVLSSRERIIDDKKNIKVNSFSTEKIIVLDLNKNKQIGVIQKDYPVDFKIADYNKKSKELIYISNSYSINKYNLNTKENSQMEFNNDKNRIDYITDTLKIEYKDSESKYMEKMRGEEAYFLNVGNNKDDKLEYEYYKKKFEIEEEIFYKVKALIKKKVYNINRKDICIENIKKLNEDKYFIKLLYEYKKKPYDILKERNMYTKDYIYDSTLNTLTPLANYLVDIKDKDIWLEKYVSDRWTNFEYVERFIKESENIDIYDIQFF